MPTTKSDAPSETCCEKCGCELNGGAAYIEAADEVWCHSCADNAERPILVLCKTCQSEGRILTSNGGPYDTDHGQCPVCNGRGDLLVECDPITLEDLENV